HRRARRLHRRAAGGGGWGSRRPSHRPRLAGRPEGVADLMSAAPRLALLGAGKIAQFHVPAARAAGWDVVAVATRPGSRTPGELAAAHDIPTVLDDLDALLDARDSWDGLLITVPVPDLLAALER